MGFVCPVSCKGLDSNLTSLVASRTRDSWVWDEVKVVFEHSALSIRERSLIDWVATVPTVAAGAVDADAVAGGSVYRYPNLNSSAA